MFRINSSERTDILLCALINPPPQSRRGVIGMPFIYLSVRASICLSISHFHVRSVSPEPFERFSLNFGKMFTLVKWCTELITQPC